MTPVSIAYTVNTITSNIDWRDQIEKAKNLLSSNICESLSFLNVSKKCCEHTELVFKSVVQKKKWALESIHLLPYHVGDNMTTVASCEKDKQYDGKAIFSIVCISLFLFAIAAGTLYDLYIQDAIPQRNTLPSKASENKDDNNKGNVQSPGNLFSLPDNLKNFAFQAIGNAFVSVDTFFLLRFPLIGFAIFFALLLAQMLSAGIISTTEDLPPVMFTDKSISIGYFQHIYVKPYTRIGPYIIGMLYGYYLSRNKCKMNINKYVCAMIWLMATSNAITVLYGLYNIYNGDGVTEGTISLYTAVHRNVWAVSVGWVIYACCTGYGGFVNTILSWKAFIPLSRLTYCAYLVHPVVIYLFYLNQKYPLFITNFNIVFIFFGFLVVSYMIAFIASMAFEAPMIGLERVFLSLFKKKQVIT
ncbi:Hypothetical predicted protein [Octopus vulgaris]|uniref:O-acyltransferase like protein-like n=1 Tax=Octopus vulgaris TaxID=6645 RepID=A0AA36EVK9_OCTVU|nr:Hypothetical predicted protein [Octopus vulgaris]